MVRYSIPTEEGGRLELELAGVGSRVGAGLIDLLVCAGLVLGLWMLLGIASSVDPTFISTVLYRLLLAGLLCVPLVWGLFFALRRRETPGKIALGLRVIDQTGGPASVGQHTLRALFMPIELLPLPVPLGILAMFIHPEGRRLGDMVAGTVVTGFAGQPAETSLGRRRGFWNRARKKDVRKRAKRNVVLVETSGVDFEALMTPGRLARLTVAERTMHGDLARRVGLRPVVRQDLQARFAGHVARRFDLEAPAPEHAGEFLEALGKAL